MSDVNLREPGLIGRVTEAISGYSSTTHRASRRNNSFLVTCTASCHSDEHPSMQLFMDTGHWRCWSHPISPAKGGILELIAQSGVADRIAGKSAAHRAMQWLEREIFGVKERPRDLKPQTAPRRMLKNSTLVATYDFQYDDETLGYQILKYRGRNDDGEMDKDFRFRRPDGAGHWIYHRKGSCRTITCYCNAQPDVRGPRALEAISVVPLDLPFVRRAIVEGRTIVVPEGEGDAVAMRTIGFAATSYPFGSKEPFPADAPAHFAGAKRVLFPADNDDVGIQFARERAAILRAAGLPAYAIAPFADLPEHGDASDAIKLNPDHRAMEERLRNAALLDAA